MGSHDLYGKALMRAVVGDGYESTGSAVYVEYGSRQPARIDGVVGDIAIEIESRVSKQVRGAVLDLICHPARRKLLILIPMHMSNPDDTATQCRNIMGRILNMNDFRVLVLEGTGPRPRADTDTTLVAEALASLGWT